MSEARKVFHLYLSVLEKEVISKRAKELKMSTNSYVRQAALSYAENTDELEMYYEEKDMREKKTFELELSNAEHLMLRLISAKMGISMSEYLRNCIRMKKLKYISMSVSHYDLDEHTILIGKLTQKVMSVCNMIVSSRNVFPQEIDKIIALLEAINADNIKILDVVYGERKKLYREAQKELLNNLRIKLGG